MSIMDQYKRRYKHEDDILQEALNKLQSIMPGKNILKKSDVSDSEIHIIKACDAVAKKLHMRLRLSESMRRGEFSADPVGDIAASSRFRTRGIILPDNWYKEDSGSFLAWLQDGSPVAVLQESANKYAMLNPRTNERSPVNRALAEQLKPNAVMFYRHLPISSDLKGISMFVLNGLDKSDLIWVLFMGVAGGLLGMLTPQITGYVFDTVIPEGKQNMLLQIGLLMAIVTFTIFIIEFTRSFAMQRISGYMERDLQSAVWDKLLSLPVNFFRHYSSGELAQRAMGISQIRQALSGPVVNTLMSGFFSFFYVVMLFLKGGSLAWLGLGIYAFSMAFTLWLGFSQIKYQRRILDINNDLSGKMFGWLGGLSKIKMTGAEKRIFNNWAELFGHSRNLTFKSRTIGNHITVYNSILMLLTSILVYYAMFAMNHPLAIGSFIAFNAALQLLLASGLQVSATMLQMNEIIPTYQRVKPILEAIPEYDDAKTDPGEISGDIEVSHIHFRYIHDGPLILNDVSLHIESGEHVALVGPSGSGKSTLFRILLGFEKPESGEIFFDSVNLDQLDIRLVRRQLGVVLQSGQLFAGSIFENIAGANISITQKDVMEAIKQAGMEEDLNLMPMGIHTVISEGSGAISGGQRQRLLIARAIAGNPKILFFDEATSALDNKTQKIVSNSINNLKATRITIAHRLSTVQDCDRIIVLENGRITEMGTYHELMNQNGTFAGMAKRQIA